MADLAMHEDNVACVEEGGDAGYLSFPHVEEGNGVFVGVINRQSDVFLGGEAEGEMFGAVDNCVNVVVAHEGDVGRIDDRSYIQVLCHAFSWNQSVI